MRVLIDENKNFYKANLHCHSTNSDGKMTPSELKNAFKSKGYSIIAFTDHEHLIDNSDLNDDDFLTITSCEVAIKEFPKQSTLKNYCMRVCHLNFYAKDPHNTVTPCYSSVADHFKNPSIEHLVKFDGEYERIYSAEGINDIIKTANEKGFLVSYNHPLWSLENARQYLEYKGLFAVEVYNHGCNRAGGNDYCPFVLDDFLRDGKRIFCTMCDDCHEYNGAVGSDSDMFGGFVMINSPKLEYDQIISDLENGNFYASQGPLIKSLVLDGDIVKIKTSDVKQISLSTLGRRTKAVNAENDGFVDYAEFKLKENDGYFRITVTDKDGKHALTQAYFI